MDLAQYINELLELHSEISVPGLGSFVYTRINGHYDDAENKFYPPRYDLYFDPQSIDDDVLANYISQRKNISASSSKYFIDKYVKNLLEQISIYEVAFTDIGYLYTENGKLAFKPKKEKPPINADFYGYSPVKILKAENQTAYTGAAVYETETTTAAAAPTAPPVEELTHLAPPVADQHNLAPAEHNYEPQEAVEEIQRNGMSIWLIITIVVVVLAAVAFVAYRYRPDLLGIKAASKADTVKAAQQKKVSLADTVKKDTTKKTAAIPADTTKKDTAKAAPAVTKPTGTVSTPAANMAAEDANATLTYELLTDAFKTETRAQNAANDYLHEGFSKAHVLPPIIGHKYRVSLGSYSDKQQAEQAKKDFLNTGKISHIDIQPYKLPTK